MLDQLVSKHKRPAIEIILVHPDYAEPNEYVALRRNLQVAVISDHPYNLNSWELTWSDDLLLRDHRSVDERHLHDQVTWEAWCRDFNLVIVESFAEPTAEELLTKALAHLAHLEETCSATLHQVNRTQNHLSRKR